MDAVLFAMESLHAGAEDVLDHVDSLFDSNRAPDLFVPFLAQWVDLERIFATREEGDNLVSTGLGRLRELIQTASYLSKWRGTREGLRSFLETAIGISGFVIEESLSKPFHLCVKAPKAAETYKPLIERIVEVERPVYATWELQFVEDAVN